MKGGIGVAVAVCFALIVQVLRGGIEQPGDMVVTLEHLRPGFLGYLAAFSEWDRVGSDSLSWGFFTFPGLFDFIGMRSREIGVYTASVSLSGVDTNIYTVFRGLIEDVGIYGALAALATVGFIAGWAYRQVRRGRYRYCVILAGYYACCIWSPIASFFAYNGLVLAWIIGGMALSWPGWNIKPARSQSTGYIDGRPEYAVQSRFV
jgi:oligosaccharide repeat unit polymerase